MSHDVVVVGAGHNGLVAAALLARAGRSVLVLERRDKVGGGAATDELLPGFNVPTLDDTLGPLRPGLAEELGLAAHGFATIESEARLVALPPSGSALTLWTDPARTARDLESHSRRDAERYPAFQAAVAAVARLLGETLDQAPPDPHELGLADVWPALRLGLGFRRLGEREAYGLLRWLPMNAADFAAEWFESETLRAALCGRAGRDFHGGPRSAGGTANLFLRAALAGGHPAGACVYARGGPGRLAEALAASFKAAGGALRTSIEVDRLLVRDGRAAGVVLKDGETLEARTVVSGFDPKSTVLRLVDPPLLHPDDLRSARHLRQRGGTAKLNLALSGLPRFTALPEAGDERLRGRLLLTGGVDDLERAWDATKYGELPSLPPLELTLPSLADPSLAPEGQHVLSAHVGNVPYAPRGGWEAQRTVLLERVLDLLETRAPGLRGLVLKQQLLVPTDLEREYGLGGGHPHHADLSLDQLFSSRPFLGWGRYRTGLSGLYLCGAGTHPGGGLTGASGRNAARELLRDLEPPRE